MAVLTVFLKTYRRPDMLRDAIESVLMQDFDDYELVIHDDASGDKTAGVVASYSDRRIRYIVADQNIGSTYGDTEIVRRLQATCDTRLCMHLNDDDFYCKADLFSTQVQLFDEIDGLAMVLGGSAQKYDHPIVLPAPAQPWHQNRYLGTGEDIIFVQNIFPEKAMSGREFLQLYAEDYPNRNIVHGAAMFRSEFLSEVLAPHFDGFAWQAGAAFNCGMATRGGIFYLDEPCLINRVDINCASFRGTQKMHYEQCLASIAAGYSKVIQDPEMKRLHDQTAMSVTWAYLGNKISNRNGAFANNPLGDLGAIMIPEITASEFFDELARYDIKLTQEQYLAIEASDLVQAGG